MTTITLTPDLEEAIAIQARKQETTPELLILDMLREKFLPLSEQTSEMDSLGDWERQMQDAAIAVEAELAKSRTSDEGHD